MKRGKGGRRSKWKEKEKERNRGKKERWGL